MLIYDFVSRQKHNSKIAIKMGSYHITYRELFELSEELGKKINVFIGENQRNIGIYLPNSIDYAVAYCAIQSIKKVAVPVSVLTKSPEIQSTFDYCEVDIIITDSCNIEVLKSSLINNKHKKMLYNISNDQILILNSSNSFVVKSAKYAFTDSDDDIAILLHTSGTTSKPKRVMLTHRNLINNIESNINSLQLTEKEITLIVLPMCFGYCNTAQFLTHLYLGATIVLMEGMFFPKSLFKVVESEKITNFTAVPSMLLMILEYKHFEKFNYSSLRTITFGGGPMPVNKLKTLIELMPTVGFVQTYGQTECSPRVTALLSEDSIRKIGSVGKPIPGVLVKVIAEDGKETNNNCIGEILVKGQNVMKGYYKFDDLNASVISDGWLHTGDLGYFDEDEYLYLTGRKKNIIISCGINIYPEEIEQIMLQYRGIKEVCVVGEDDEFKGEVPVAYIVKTEEIAITELKEFCLENLAYYKVPARFIFIEQLPKTYNGKIKRNRNGEKI